MISSHGASLHPIVTHFFIYSSENRAFSTDKPVKLAPLTPVEARMMNTERLIYQTARIARDSRFDGQFFVAVKSTGIFCRPICPAPSPKEHNVEYFQLAQSAIEAGYRPCLRCRPDSAPGSCAWRGVDTTVDRAVHLLKTCADIRLQDIAEKLGVSDRYLRELFQQRLGISPKRFRLYDQLLFAKHMLHQTSLSVEDVAQASGFSSARRLQENLKSTLKLTPSQIRKQSRTQEHIAVTSEPIIRLQLAFRPPYNWPQVRDFLAIRAIEGIEWVDPESYARTFTINQSHGWFKARYCHQQHRFDVELRMQEMGVLHNVVNEIRRILDLDADPMAIEAGLLATGLDAQSLQVGVRIPGIWNVFEAGCRAILGQQISVSAAVKLVGKLAHELGHDSTNGILFPTAEAVSESDLSFLGMPQSRRDTLQRFAQYCQAHPQQINLAQWLGIKGIGPWTVAYAQMRDQSQPDVWLNTDLIIKQQIQRHTLNADAAAPWRSYLTFQLWSLG